MMKRRNVTEPGELLYGQPDFAYEARGYLKEIVGIPLAMPDQHYMEDQE